MADELAIRLSLAGVAQVNKGLAAVSGKLLAVGSAIASFAAVQRAVDYVTDLTLAAIKTADEMGKLAQKVGIATETISSLSYVARLGSVDQAEFQKALTELGKEMVKQGRESEGLESRLLNLADIFASMPDGIQKSKLALDNFGKAGLQMIPFLNQGSEVIRKQRMEAEQFGLIISNEFAQNAAQFNDNMFRIKSAFSGVFMVVAESLLPSLIKLTEAFISFIKESNAVASVGRAIVEVYKTVATSITYVSAGFESMAAFASTFNDVFNNTLSITKAWEAAMDALGPVAYKHALQLQSIASIGEKVAESTKKAVKPLEEYVELSTRLATLKSILAVEKGGMDWIKDSGLVKGAEKRSETIRNLQTQLKLAKEIEAEISKTAPTVSGTSTQAYGLLKNEKQIEFETKLLAIQKERYGIEKQLQEAEANNSFTGRLSANIDELSDKWGNLSVNIANTLTGSMSSAIDTLSNGLANAIFRAQTLGEALIQVGRTVAIDLVGSFIKMGLQWAITQLFMTNVSTATEAVRTAASIAGTKARAFASIGEAEAVGVTAAAGAASSVASVPYVGPFLAAAAFASILGMIQTAIVVAAAANTVGFESGGYTGNGGTSQIAGAVHGREFVFNAPATARIGVANLQALQDGEMSAASAPNVTNIFVADENAARQMLRSRAGTSEVIRIFKMNKAEIGA